VVLLFAYQATIKESETRPQKNLARALRRFFDGRGRGKI